MDGGCLEQNKCSLCNQLPGQHDELTCITDGCTGEKEPKCFWVLEWNRYNLRNIQDADARYWGSDGSVITLNDPTAAGTPNSETNPIFQFIPTSNRVGDGSRFERCSFKIANTEDGFLKQQGDD